MKGYLCYSEVFETFFFVLVFRATDAAYGGFRARGLIRARAAGLRHSHSNARSLTHGTRPGMELASSWILVRFISAEPQPWLKLTYTSHCDGKRTPGLRLVGIQCKFDQVLMTSTPPACSLHTSL